MNFDQKPDWMTDEQWAEYQREDRVVQFDQSRKRKRKPPPPPPGGWPDWHRLLLTDERNRPIANVANALIGLRHDQETKGALIFDQMMQESLVAKSRRERAASLPANISPTPCRQSTQRTQAST
jgi:hypothetical protein